MKKKSEKKKTFLLNTAPQTPAGGLKYPKTALISPPCMLKEEEK